MAQLKNEMLSLKEENKILKMQWEEEIKLQWESNFERFSPQLDQVKATVMRMVFPHKETLLENLLEALEMISSRLEFRV